MIKDKIDVYIALSCVTM